MKPKDELESGEHISPDIQDEDDPRLADRSSLQLYLEYLRAKREFQEAWLKSHGMTWTKLEELEDGAIAEMQTTNTETVQLDKYVATLHSNPIRLFPDTAKIIGHCYRISLHSKR